MSRILHPIINPDRGFTEWAEKDIYTGPDGTGQHVPNVDDKVWSWNRGVLRVTDVNIDTGLSVLKEWKAPNQNRDSEIDDLLIGNGGHEESKYYQAYVDHSVNPSTIEVDSKLRIYPRNAVYFKYFRGTDITVTGEVISRNYDGAGNYINDKVPMHYLGVEHGYDRTVAVPEGTHTTEALQSGEIISVVGYNEEGGQCSVTRLTVQETSLYSKGLINSSYVTDIELRSPWLSEDGVTVEVPVNLPVVSMGLSAVVHYNNGDTIEYPVDGNRFALYGLDDYVTATPDFYNPLTLSYQMGDNEESTSISVTGSGHITKAYKLHTLKAQHEYNLKLYVYPQWINGGWQLRYYLHNLSRDLLVEVTEQIEFGIGSITTFNPTLWGVEQNLTVSIRLDKVNPSYVPYRHVQTFKVTLLSEPTNASAASWLVNYEAGYEKVYGEGVAAIQTLNSATSYKFRLSSGCLTVEEWLAKVFYSTIPLYDKEVEANAPRPSHYDVIVNGVRERFELDNWNTDHIFTSGLNTGDNVEVIWVKQTEHQDLLLGISNFMVKVN